MNCNRKNNIGNAHYHLIKRSFYYHLQCLHVHVHGALQVCDEHVNGMVYF